MTSHDFPPNPIYKEGYFLSFNDEFNSSELDTSMWLPYYLPQWSSREKSATNYQLEKDRLILRIEEDQAPWCPEFNGTVKVSSLQTGLFAGELGSPFGQHRFSEKCRVREEQTPLKLYTPQYGYFEIRAKALASSTSVCAFWMIGFEETPEQSAEICIMEIKGKNIHSDTSVNGYGLRAFDDPNLKDEFFEEAFLFDATNFHLYAAHWQPDKIDFYLDNQKVKTIFQSPNYEMQFMLNIYEVPNEGVVDTNEHFPKQFEIDYVRAYQASSGY